MGKVTLFSSHVKSFLRKIERAFLEEMNIPGNEIYGVDRIEWALHALHSDENGGSIHIFLDFKVKQEEGSHGD